MFNSFGGSGGFGGSSGFGNSQQQQQQGSSGFGFGGNTQQQSSGFGSSSGGFGGSTGFGSSSTGSGFGSSSTGGMFGSSSTGGSSGFGDQSSSGFGSSTTGFGTGSGSSGFGSSTGFGGSTSGSGFGGNTSGFGGQQQSSTGGFGSSGFGSGSSTGFGGSTSGSGFGGGNTSGFGGQQQSTGGMFGSSSTLGSGFGFGGQNNSFSGGSSSTAGSGFGSSLSTSFSGLGGSSTSGFGQQKTDTGSGFGFGGTSSFGGGLNTSGSGFSSGFSSGMGGGGAPKFEAVREEQKTKQGQTSVSNYQSITRQDFYKNYSFEELAWEFIKTGGNPNYQGSTGGSGGLNTSGFNLGGSTGGGLNTSGSGFNLGGTSSTFGNAASTGFNLGGSTGGGSNTAGSGFNLGGSTGTGGTSTSFNFGSTGGSTGGTTGGSGFNFGSGGTTGGSTGSSAFNLGGSTGGTSTSFNFGTTGGGSGGTTGGSSFNFGTGGSTGGSSSGFNLGGGTTGGTSGFNFGQTSSTGTSATGGSTFNLGGTGGASTAGSGFNFGGSSAGNGKLDTGSSNFNLGNSLGGSSSFNFSSGSTGIAGNVKVPEINVNPYGTNELFSAEFKETADTEKQLETKQTSPFKGTPKPPTHVRPRTGTKRDAQMPLKDRLSLFHDVEKESINTTVFSTKNDIKTLTIFDDDEEPEKTVDFNTSNVSEQLDLSKDFDINNSSILDREEFTKSPRKDVIPFLPKLTKLGYYTIPSMEDIQTKSLPELRNIKDFVVGCENLGSVTFLGITDVTKLDLDQLVIFENKSVEVYPDEVEDQKPEPGTVNGLNKPSIITLCEVYKKKKNNDEKFLRKLHNACVENGSTFVDYNKETGEFVFKVEHFTRYGLDDSDDSDEGEDIVKRVPEKRKVISSTPTPKPFTPKAFTPKGEPKFQPFTKQKLVVISDEEESDEDQEVKQPSDEDDEISLDDMYEDYDEETPITENFHPESPEIPTQSHGYFPEQLGLNPSKIMEMKGNFFAEENSEEESEESEDEEYAQKPSFQAIRSFGRPTIKHPKEYSSKMEKDYSYETELFKPSYSVVPLQHQTIEETEKEYLIPEEQKSSTFQKMTPNNMMISNARSFRVCFTPSGKIIRFNKSESISKLEYSKVIGEKLDKSTADQLYLRNLKTSLQNSINKKSENEVPYIELRKDPKSITKTIDEFISNYSFTSPNLYSFENYQKSTFELLKALFSENEISDGDTYANEISRRRRLSDWLMKIVSLPTEESKSDLEQIYQKLIRYQINDAIKIAFSTNNYYLAIILSQISSNTSYKSDLQKQMDLWKKDNTEIHPQLEKIYSLLSGNVTNCTLDWKRNFGLHLWYLHSNSSTISDSVKSYINYIQKGNAIFPTNGSKVYEDTWFHILKLYSGETKETIGEALNPLNHTKDILEYRLSWHLLQLFKTFQGITVGENIENLISMNFSDQLERNGLWEWSIFVVLHIKNEDTREKAVKNILSRNIEKITLSIESFLMELKIPVLWVYQAKALHAAYTNDFQTQFDIYLECGCKPYLEKAHTLFMNELAPRLLIDEQHKDIMDMLEKLQMVKDQLHNWAIRGDVYLKYYGITEKINEFIEKISQFDFVTSEIEETIQQIESELFDISDSLRAWVENIKEGEENSLKAVCISQMATATAKNSCVIEEIGGRFFNDSPESINLCVTKNMNPIVSSCSKVEICNELIFQNLKMISDSNSIL
eukprot:gene6072-10080_t